MNLKKIFDGYSNNPDYFGDWFGKGQIDFSAVINPEDEGDFWMVKLWSGSGYSLDVYIVKANDVYDAIDKVFEWSYNNEGANNIVMDYEYISNECKEWFKDEPDMFGKDLSDDYEEFEQRWFDDYIADEMSGLYARSENFFVNKIPAEIVEKYNVGKKTDSKRIKDSRISRESDTYKTILREIAEMIREGYYSGYDPVQWSIEVVVDGKDISDFSFEDRDIIYNDISYPIGDGYDNYLGVEVELSDGTIVYADYELNIA